MASLVCVCVWCPSDGRFVARNVGFGWRPGEESRGDTGLVTHTRLPALSCGVVYRDLMCVSGLVEEVEHIQADVFVGQCEEESVFQLCVSMSVSG